MKCPVASEHRQCKERAKIAKIAPTDTYVFEQWLLKNHPDLFGEWELEACEWLELDEWLWKEHYEVLDEWDRFRATNPTWRPDAAARKERDDAK